MEHDVPAGLLAGERHAAGAVRTLRAAVRFIIEYEVRVDLAVDARGPDALLEQVVKFHIAVVLRGNLKVVRIRIRHAFKRIGDLFLAEIERTRVVALAELRVRHVVGGAEMEHDVPARLLAGERRAAGTVRALRTAARLVVEHEIHLDLAVHARGPDALLEQIVKLHIAVVLLQLEAAGVVPTVVVVFRLVIVQHRQQIRLVVFIRAGEADAQRRARGKLRSVFVIVFLHRGNSHIVRGGLPVLFHDKAVLRVDGNVEAVLAERQRAVLDRKAALFGRPRAVERLQVDRVFGDRRRRAAGVVGAVQRHKRGHGGREVLVHFFHDHLIQRVVLHAVRRVGKLRIAFLRAVVKLGRQFHLLAEDLVTPDRQAGERHFAVAVCFRLDLQHAVLAVNVGHVAVRRGPCTDQVLVDAAVPDVGQLCVLAGDAERLVADRQGVQLLYNVNARFAGRLCLARRERQHEQRAKDQAEYAFDSVHFHLFSLLSMIVIQHI